MTQKASIINSLLSSSKDNYLCPCVCYNFRLILFKAKQEMKIQKKTLFKWQIQELQLPKTSKYAQNRNKNDLTTEPAGTVLSLPQSVLEQSKLAEIKTIMKQKNSSYQAYLQDYNSQRNPRQYYNILKATLKNRTKQLFKPLKKHNSAIDKFKATEEEPELNKIKISKKAPISSEHSSQKALNILEKIILKEVDFYANKKKIDMELQANRLPIIQYKESKRKQSLAAYEAQFNASNASLIKYQATQNKSPRVLVKKQKQKPYLSGWDVSQTSDF